MEHANKLISAASAFALLAVALALSLAPVSAADTAYDQDLGQFYSYTVFFGFDGEETESILWDFGDGSETSADWNVTHTFSAKGTYYVTQTATNPLGSSVAVYKVQIMGFPVITFSTDGGSAVGSIQQTAYDVAAAVPEAPSKDGYTFGGWYKDSGLTTAVDWSEKITSSATYYAKWTVASGSGYVVTFVVGESNTYRTVAAGGTVTAPADPVVENHAFGGWYTDAACTAAYDFTSAVTGNMSLYAKLTANGGDDDHDGSNTGTETIAPIAIAVAGLLMTVGGAYLSRYGFSIAGIILIGFALAVQFGVIGWPF